MRNTAPDDRSRLGADSDAAGRLLAFARIGVGLAAAIMGWQTAGYLRAIDDPMHVRVPPADWSPTLSSAWIFVLVAVWWIGAISLILGVLARWAALAVAIAATVAVSADWQTWSNHLTLIVCLCVLLSLSQPASAWSLSGRSDDRRVSDWSISLIRVLISTMYFFAAVSKVNAEFLGGQVLAAQLRASHSLPGAALRLAACAAIAVELFIALGLWSDRFRPFAIGFGLALHASFLLFLLDPWPLLPFMIAALATYPLFWNRDPITVPVPPGRRNLDTLRSLDRFGLVRLDETAITSEIGTRSSTSPAHAVIERSPFTMWFGALLRVPPFHRWAIRLVE